MVSGTDLARAAVVAALLIGSGAMVPPPAHAQQKVGVSGGVNQEATGVPPGAPARRLVIGQDIVYNERVTTSPIGQTQVLFVDESALSVGPNSDITIDKFVYNPSNGTGQMAMTAARGVMRFVGGKLSKQEDNAVTLNTNAATIGIRGGVFLADLSTAGQLQVVFLYGNGLTVTGPPRCARQTITRPGYEVSVGAGGACPSAPFPAPRNTTAALIAQLDGRPGANGGAPQIPNEGTIVASGIANTISADFAGNIRAAAQNRPFITQPPQLSVASLQNQLQVNTVQNQGAIFRSTQSGTSPTNPVNPINPVNPVNPVVVTYAGGFSRTNGNANTQGYGVQPTPYAAGTLTNGVFTTTIGTSQVTIPLAAGTASFGSSGTTSPLGPVTGTTFLSSDGTFFYANLTPINAPAEREFIYGGLPTSTAALQTPGSAAQFSAFAVQPDNALQSTVPFIQQATGGSLANVSVSPLFVAKAANSAFAPTNGNGSSYAKALQVSLGLNGTGANQSQVLVVAVGNAFTPTVGAGQPILNGSVSGISRLNSTDQPTRINSSLLTPSDGNGNSFYGGNAISGFVLSQNNCCNSTGTIFQPATATNTSTGVVNSYAFEQPVTATALPAGFSTAQTTRTQTGWFGGTMFAQPNGVPYVLAGTTTVSTDASDLQIAATFTGNDPFTPTSSGISSATLSFGSLSAGNTAARQAFINDSLFAALESPDTASQINGVQAVDSNNSPLGASHIYMVNANAVPGATAGILPSGVSVCNCQYLQWGYWGGEVDSASLGRSDIGGINTWIAGVPTVTLPTSGVGTYTGAAIGSVFNNGANYLAAGGFTNTYDFAERSGTIAITNFDGHNFTGGVGAGTGPNYSGTIAAAGFAGNVNGTFFGPLAAETGGNFSVQSIRGTPYLASGIFAGVRGGLGAP